MISKQLRSPDKRRFIYRQNATLRIDYFNTWKEFAKINLLAVGETCEVISKTTGKIHVVRRTK